MNGGDLLKKILTLIGLLVIVIFIVSNAELFTMVWKSDLDSVITILTENLLLTFVVTFVLMIVQNSFTIIPLILLLTINVAIFGFIYGYLWSWVTSVVASGFIFYATRNWFQAPLLKKMGPKWKESVVEHGFMYVFTGRIFPLIPTSLINLAKRSQFCNLQGFFISDRTRQSYILFLSILNPLWSPICGNEPIYTSCTRLPLLTIFPYL